MEVSLLKITIKTLALLPSPIASNNKEVNVSNASKIMNLILKQVNAKKHLYPSMLLDALITQIIVEIVTQSIQTS